MHYIWDPALKYWKLVIVFENFCLFALIFCVSVVYPFCWAFPWTDLLQRCDEGNTFDERVSLSQGNCKVEQYFAISTPWTSTSA